MTTGQLLYLLHLGINNITLDICHVLKIVLFEELKARQGKIPGFRSKKRIRTYSWSWSLASNCLWYNIYLLGISSCLLYIKSRNNVSCSILNIVDLQSTLFPLFLKQFLDVATMY